jgi:hypothetical protein
MNSFKGIAHQILKEAGKPLHSRVITKIALEHGWLKTAGKTPEATMNAQLVVDINSKKEKSRFVKTSPSIFGLNRNYKTPEIVIKPTSNGKTISEDFVKNSIIKWLSANNWGHFQFGGLRERGVDIKAKHNQYPIYDFIETKGQGKIRQARQADEVAFVYSLGQIITRMKTNNTRNKHAIGLPTTSAKIALRRLPYQVAKKLLLYIFSVDQNGNVNQYSWQDLKKGQELK